MLLNTALFSYIIKISIHTSKTEKDTTMHTNLGNGKSFSQQSAFVREFRRFRPIYRGSTCGWAHSHRSALTPFASLRRAEVVY